jgi:hypothetical protein
MKYIKNYLKFRPINEDSANEVGITYEADFTEEDKSIIEEEIIDHITEMLEAGITSGELNGVDPYYSGWYSVKIEKDDNDEETRNIQVAKQIRDGYKSGLEPKFSWCANVYA